MLAASIDLTSSSQELMSILSDLQTESALRPGESYLSGYPLPEDRRFVLARTWGASEKFRPGSVWTQSLVIDYPTLALMPNPAGLLKLFRNPEMAPSGQRAAPIASDQIDALSVGASTFSASSANACLSQLYGRNCKKRIIAECSEINEDESLAMALWSQMWPSLRRTFAFFSRSVDRTPLRGVACSLYFEALSLDAPETFSRSEGWVQSLSKDLYKSRRTALRRFLARYSVGSEEPRALVPSLVEIFDSRFDVDTTLAEFESGRGLEKLSRLKRDFLRSVLRDGASLSRVERVIQYFAPQPSFITKAEVDDLAQRSVAFHPIGELLSLCGIGDPGTFGRDLFDGIARKTDVGALALSTPNNLRSRMLHSRPEVGACSDFWNAPPGLVTELAFQSLAQGIEPEIILLGIGSRLPDVFAAHLARIRPALIPQILGQLDLEASREVVLANASQDPEATASIISIVEHLSVAELEAVLSGVVRSERLPPWNNALAKCAVNMLKTKDCSTSVLGFSYAYSIHEVCGFDLLSSCFDRVLEAAEHNTFSEDAQRILRKQLSSQGRLLDGIVVETVNVLRRRDGGLLNLFSVTTKERVLARLFRFVQSECGTDAIRQVHDQTLAVSRVGNFGVDEIDKVLRGTLPLLAKPLSHRSQIRG